MPDADVIPARQRRRSQQTRCALSRRAFSVGAAAIAALAVSGGRPARGGEDPMADLRALLRDSVKAGDPPGLVALIARGVDVRVEVAGVRDLETRAPMQRDTLFAVASIGKPITAVSALMLVEDGVLGLDAPVGARRRDAGARRRLHQGPSRQRRRPRAQRLRARGGGRGLPHLLDLRPRLRPADRRACLPRPHAARAEREGHDGLGAPARRVRGRLTCRPRPDQREAKHG